MPPSLQPLAKSAAATIITLERQQAACLHRNGKRFPGRQREAGLTTLSRHTLPTANLLEDTNGCSSLLPSASADVRSSADAVASKGPTHMINMAKGNAFALGTYDPQTEHMTLSDCKTVAAGVEYAWTATGTDASGRVLSIAWLW